MSHDVILDTVFAYVENGVCLNCSRPAHLFAHSMLTHEQTPRCIDCLGRALERRYHTTDIHAYADVEAVRVFLYEQTHYDPIVQFPEMYQDERCYGCGNVFVDNPPAPSYEKQLTLSDSGDDVWAHAQCCKSCEVCEKHYASSSAARWSCNWRHTGGQRDFTNIQGEEMCNGCLDVWFEENGGRDSWIICEACSEYEHRDSARWYCDELYCDPCYDNNVYECDDCGETYWSEHDCSAYNDGDGSSYSSYIHSYSYRPQTHFFGEAKYHMGFELEVEARNTSRNEGAELAHMQLGDRAYLKEDGSLSDGFEIVTHPHTLKMYQTSFPWDTLEKLQRAGMRSWNTRTCGLHVHVSRKAFQVKNGMFTDIVKTQGHELRFMKLIYDNQRMVERIAGRSNNNYATFEDKSKLVAKVKYGTQSNGRYSAINTENDATLEVRVFKGSLRKERVLSALEFVHGAVEYTRNLKVTGKNNALSWLQFTRYVAENQEQYPNLALIMNESFSRDSAPEDNGDE